jgi:hypothetical protein
MIRAILDELKTFWLWYLSAVVLAVGLLVGRQ